MNYIGLHDDTIAAIWRGFIAYSHYDGVRSWDYPEAMVPLALVRLKRLRGRPVFACNEQSIKETREYVEGTGLGATVTFVTIPFRNHNDAWVLRDIPERRRLREWLKQVVNTKPGIHVNGWRRSTGAIQRASPGSDNAIHGRCENDGGF